MKKLLSVLMTVLLLCGSLAIFPVSAENKLVFLPTQTDTYADGGYYATGDMVAEAYGDEGIIINGTFRTLWAITNPVADKMPYLIIQVEEGFENLTRFTATHLWHFGEQNQKDIDLTGADSGAICINLFELLSDEDKDSAIGNAVYLTPYFEGRVVFKKLYLSDTDLRGNVYVPPTQPSVPSYPAQYEILKQLPIAAEQITTPEDDPDRWKKGQFLIAENVNVKPINEGKGMELTLKETPNNYAEGNIAWVFPYEWLVECPYLVLEFANEGRPDEGPKTNIISYWEGVSTEEGGKFAKLQDVEGTAGANKYNGVNRWNLKFSLDQIDQQYKANHNGASIAAVKGQGVALQLWIGVDSADQTTFDPLVVTNAYLLGYEKGVAALVSTTTRTNNDKPVTTEHINKPSNRTTPASNVPTSANDNDNSAGNGEVPLWWWIVLGTGVLAIGVGSAIFGIWIGKRRKKNDF